MNSYTDKIQQNKKPTTPNTITQNKNNSTAALSYKNISPAAVTQMQLQEIANNSLQVKQAMQLQTMANNSEQAKDNQNLNNDTQNTDNEVVQRVIAPSFAAKARRANGTAIPTTATGEWKRPKWLRGDDQAVQTIITNLITAGKAEVSPHNPSHIFDRYTGTWVSIIGVSIDHIVDWKSFAESKGAADYQALEDTYHEMDNLVVTGSRINSSSLQTDPLEWMAGRSHENFMNLTGNQRGQQRLDGFMQELIGVDPDMQITSIPEARRGQFLSHLGTIQNPRQGATMTEPMNAFSLMMAYQGARHIAGVRDHNETTGMQEEEKMDETD